VAAEPRVGDASLAIAAYHEHLAERVGSVRLSVLYQRLRDEQHLHVSWASFYRYARQHWPDRLRPSPRITVRVDDPPPGEEARSITSTSAIGSILRLSIGTGCRHF